MTLRKCPMCDGSGEITLNKKKCDACGGLGRTKIVLGSAMSTKKNDKYICKKCNGTGYIAEKDTCPVCKGKGKISVCWLCGKEIPAKFTLCEKCHVDPVIYRLVKPSSIDTIVEGHAYIGRVQQKKDFGLFVDLTDDIHGLIRPHNLPKRKYKPGERIAVRVIMITPDKKIELEPIPIKRYTIRNVHDPIPRRKISEIENLRKDVGVYLWGLVTNVTQTPGPTAFTIMDETGIVSAVAFESAGERAYPEINQGDYVELSGRITEHKGEIQIEIEDMSKLGEDDAAQFAQAIEDALDKRAEPEDIDFLIENDVLERLKPLLRKVAKRIRRAIFTGQTIIIRHHADTDGISAGVALETAISALIQEVAKNPDAVRYKVIRSPSKAPFYEYEDAVRDLYTSIENSQRFGESMPIVVVLDMGSSHESINSYLKLKVFGIEILVVDHHFPDERVKDIVDVHVNPYYVNGDYNISGGMLGTELARFVNSGPDIEEQISHLAAVAGIADHVEGDALEKYIEVAKQKGYDEEMLRKIGLAVDYEAFFLRYSDGRGLVNDLLGVQVPKERHIKHVELVSKLAEDAINNQMNIVMPNIQSKKLDNGVNLYMIDVEKFAKKFEFPAPGKTTGAVHDEMVSQKEGEPVVTLGIGPDFVVLRSKNILINFPQIVKNLQSEMPSAGVEGGGHEVVGSVKFVEGKRDEFIKRLIDELSKSKVADDKGEESK